MKSKMRFLTLHTNLPSSNVRREFLLLLCVCHYDVQKLTISLLTSFTDGRSHPDPVVENATLAACSPPDISYNLAMPADIILDGKLSNLQLEAIVYGCQRHMMDLPKPPPSMSSSARPVNEKENSLPSVPEGVDSKADVKPAVLGDVKPDMNNNSSPTGEGLKREPPAYRAGFLLGDGAGMGKGRTLAGFVVENIARGRKKHVWISVSSDLYEGEYCLDA